MSWGGSLPKLIAGQRLSHFWLNKSRGPSKNIATGVFEGESWDWPRGWGCSFFRRCSGRGLCSGVGPTGWKARGLAAFVIHHGVEWNGPPKPSGWSRRVLWFGEAVYFTIRTIREKRRRWFLGVTIVVKNTQIRCASSEENCRMRFP